MSETITPIKLNIKAQEATPGPPIGPVLAPKKVRIVDFCKEFNDKTKHLTKGTPVPVRIFVKKDGKFTLSVKQPLTSHLLKTAASINKGSAEPNKNKVGVLSIAQLKAIAEQKMADLNATSLEAAMRILAGSAKSMGIEIREEV